MESSNVRLQIFLALTSGTLAVILCEHRGALPILFVELIGLAISYGFAGWYYFHVDSKYRDAWKREATEGLVGISIGIGVPFMLAFVRWLAPSFSLAVSHTTQTVWVGVSATIVFTAILTSSMVDRFLILPRILGLWGDAIWVDTGASENQQNRRLGQVWIAQRGICELFVFVSLGVGLAIVVTAIARSVSHNETLSDALNAIGGSVVVIGAFSQMSRRLGKALPFMLRGDVILGGWYTTKNSIRISEISGIAVDVSIEPGVKIITADETCRFVGLDITQDLEAVKRPPTIDDAWQRKMVLKHLLKLKDPDIWSGPGSISNKSAEDTKVAV